MSEFPNYIKPVPEDPGNLADRLRATGVPMNNGIAMLINAPAMVVGYSCAGCGHQKTFAAPMRLTREQIRHAACGACGSERVSLNCQGGV